MKQKMDPVPASAAFLFLRRRDEFRPEVKRGRQTFPKIFSLTNFRLISDVLTDLTTFSCCTNFTGIQFGKIS